MERINNLVYPRISIITPSYNQGKFIEETIQSVIAQGYPNLEYFIIDGGSTDNTIEVIQKYESHITYWVSEPDRGQTHAINKGLARATGDILAYLNSDDYYLPGTLFKVADHFRQHPETDLLHGACQYVDESGQKIGAQLGEISRFDEIVDLWGIWWKKRQFVQPEVFWSRRTSDRVGEFNESLYYGMDYEYWCRILLAGGHISCLEDELTCFRLTTTQKSNQSAQVADELLSIVRPWLWDPSTPIAWTKRLRLQGQWLYQALLIKQINCSTVAGDRKLLRWFKSARILFSHPQIFLSPALHRRITRVLQRQNKALSSC